MWSGSYLWLLETNSTIPGHHTECPGALAITLQIWNWSYGCHIFVPPSEVLKKITWMQDGLQILQVLEAVEEWRSRYKTSCLWMALWFQYRHWRVKASFLTSSLLTVQKFTSAIQKLLLSFLGSCCAVVMVGDLGRRKEESDSFKISSDTKC